MREPDKEPVINQLLSVAQGFADARAISLSRVSTLAFNDGGKLKALQNGADIGARRLGVAMLWFSENWPEGAVWPEGIERPFPERELINTGLPQVGSFQ